MSTIAKDQTQINEKIRAKELRLIGQDGEQIGVKSKREALEIRTAEKRKRNEEETKSH